MSGERRVNHWLVRAGVCGFAICLLFPSGCKRSPQDMRDRFMQRGERYFEKKDYRRAALEFQNASSQIPNDAEPHYKMAVALLAVGDYRTAIAHLIKATALNPKHIAAQTRLTQLMASSRDPQVLKDAQGRLSTALAMAPDDPDLLTTLALTDLRMEKPAEAEKVLERALAKSPGHLRSAMTLAGMKFAQKDFPGAEKILKNAAGQAPKSTEPLMALARFYAMTGKLPEAEAELNQAINIDPKHGPSLLGLAALRYRAGKTAEAEQLYKRVAALPGQEYRAAYALYLLSTKQNERGIQELERLHKQYPSDRDLRNRLFAAYLLANHAGQAEQLLNATLQKNSKDFTALLQRGALYARTGRIPQAETDLNAARQLEPESAEVHYNLATVRRARGEALAARQELTEAVKFRPGLLPARLELAASFLTSNNPKDALRILDAAPREQKGDLRLVLARNSALMGTGDLAEARKGVDAALRVVRTPDLLLQDAQLKFAQKDVAGGRKSLEEALKSAPEDVRALELLAVSYAAEKQVPKALEVVRAQARQRPNSAVVQYVLATWLASTGQNAEARTALAAAKKAGGDAYKAPDLLLADLDSREGKRDAARKTLTSLLTAPGNIGLQARILLGGLEIAAGNYPAAIEHYKKALELQPQNALVMNNLAYLLVEYANQFDEGLKYAQQAKELAPKDLAIDDTIGWAFYKKGLYGTAIPSLERAATDGRTARRKYHLAMAYLKNGDISRGKAVLEAARKMDPGLPEAAVAQSLLASAPRGK
jgi:tetratricopeptide (TPR) repeat protein